MGWKLEEARLVQTRTAVSGANADAVDFSASPVPEGKLWWVIGFGYYPSAAETKIISIAKTTRSGAWIGLLNPISMALNPAVATVIEQGMELLLLPGEFITIFRDSHTAGSHMTANMEIVETDLPLYTYDEPQIVKRQARALSTIRQRLGGGIGAGSSPMIGPRGGPGRPGGGGPAPI